MRYNPRPFPQSDPCLPARAGGPAVNPLKEREDDGESKTMYVGPWCGNSRRVHRGGRRQGRAEHPDARRLRSSYVQRGSRRWRLRRRGGGTTFSKFFAEFLDEGEVGAWKFNNDRAEVNRGTPITLTNRGGETHTFTRVAQFGGGFVEPLNARPDGPPLVTAPECFAPPSKNNV